KQATARVPVLLRRGMEFRGNINSGLKVLGILANRTLRAALTNDEETKLNLLRDQCKDAWGEDVPQVKCFIRQSAEVRDVEDCGRPLCPEDSMYESFVTLAREVESRLPMFCRPAGRVGKGVLS